MIFLLKSGRHEAAPPVYDAFIITQAWGKSTLFPKMDVNPEFTDLYKKEEVQKNNQ